MKVRLTERADTVWGWQEPGFEIEHPDAHFLVKLGIAEAVSEKSDESRPATAPSDDRAADFDA